MSGATETFDGFLDISPGYLVLAAGLSLLTVFVFGVGRLFLSGFGEPRAIQEAVLIAVIALTALGAFSNAYLDGGLATTVLVALGSPVGLAIAALAILAIESSTTDSPTWLLWLGYLGFFLLIGALAHGVGSVVRQLA
jgi:hypothetical protein